MFASTSLGKHGKLCNQLTIPSRLNFNMQYLNWDMEKEMENGDDGINDEIVEIFPYNFKFSCIIFVCAQSELLDLIFVNDKFQAKSVNDIKQPMTPHLTEIKGNSSKNGHSPGISPASSTESVCDLDLDACISVNVHHQDYFPFCMDGYLAGCVVAASCKSTLFVRNLLQYVRYQCHLHHLGKCHKLQSKSLHYMYGDRKLFEEWHTEAFLSISVQNISKQWLDYKWCERISNQVYKHMMLDEAMSWLNTLGGGFSALGDYFSQHAEQAGKISIFQLKIALEMGDPPTVMRCNLYLAQSLMQRGFLRQAKHMIRHEFRHAQSLPVKDTRLLAMCQGLWSRLRFLYKKRSLRTLKLQNRSVAMVPGT